MKLKGFGITQMLNEAKDAQEMEELLSKRDTLGYMQGKPTSKKIQLIQQKGISSASSSSTVSRKRNTNKRRSISGSSRRSSLLRDKESSLDRSPKSEAETNPFKRKGQQLPSNSVSVINEPKKNKSKNKSKARKSASVKFSSDSLPHNI